MRSGDRLPTNESEFFQRVKKDTGGKVFWERIEPKTEGGFPDTHFVVQPFYRVPLNRGYRAEGTIEFKYSRTRIPNLKTLMKPSQKASFIDYYQGHGNNRFLLSCNPVGLVRLYTAREVYNILLNREDETAAKMLDLEKPSFGDELSQIIQVTP